MPVRKKNRPGHPENRKEEYNHNRAAHQNADDEESAAIFLNHFFMAALAFHIRPDLRCHRMTTLNLL
jgi:hypothetical protein